MAPDSQTISTGCDGKYRVFKICGVFRTEAKLRSTQNKGTEANKAFRKPNGVIIYFNQATIIEFDGKILDENTEDTTQKYGVRTVLTITGGDHLLLGEFVRVFGMLAQYIENSKILIGKCIAYGPFDTEQNEYEGSDINKFIRRWFKNKIRVERKRSEIE